MKYRKKPVVVEAFKFDGDFKTRTGEHYVPLWAEAALHEGIICFAGERCQILAFFVSLSTANCGKKCAKEIYFCR